ncbi:hypothetical protein A1O1_06120 [Capronia coronata CBS 617.96]|uniref:Major facilitator superfamily (MFS) profile domain-containing protein n=1 Tax=Capronia coronata CBS 617.96 TaxID=1182541 RepID=W9XYW5_9EURO|nr:uncharacterized protein A1O1_06120 [Capronia coronata CBS 617.96]EXJ85752.1 hypothetical protein A1O1_06120 [Capronia coronata CBS 617.96]
MAVSAADKTTSDDQIAIEGGKDERVVKCRSDGIPLVPQPSDDPEDPLNWSSAKKHSAAVTLALMSFVLKFTTTLIAPGAHTLAAQFGTPASKATYIGSTPTIMFSVAPLLWIPLSSRYGRRPITLIGNFMAIWFAIGVAESESYASALVCRIFMGFCGAAGLCLGPAGIADMFFLHEKGRHMGLNTVLLVSAPYAGGVAGGAVQFNKSLGWRWSMYIAAIIYSGLFVAQLLLVPETLYPRPAAGAPAPKSTTTGTLRKLGFRKPTYAKDPTWLDLFSRPVAMFAYPTVLLPSIWFSLAAMTEVANTAGFPLNFGEHTRWNFNTRSVGFCSFSGFIGALLGEIFAGPLCDFIAGRALAKKRAWVPEKILPVTFISLVTIPAGLLLYGLELEYPTGWAAALTGVAIFAFGQEVALTAIMTYLVDCYPQRASECSVVFQFWRNLMAFHPPFYVPQWIESGGGAKVPYIVFACLAVGLFPFGVGTLLWKGSNLRARGPMFSFSHKQ